ncbi:MAG: RHS repeat-associated core domain-containing protein, partial [Anaerolineae bacterium]
QRIALRKNGAVSYLFGDHLGSTSVTADATGVRTGELWYKPWGENRGTPVGATPTTYRFTGQREDASIGLYFYNARYYDPALGRFAQADTIVPQAQNPQNFNRYSYAANNPLRYTDPTGHCVFAPPWDTLVCIGVFAVLTLAGSSSPPPPEYPKNYSSRQRCTDPLPDCFGDVVRLKDFSGNGRDNPIPIKEFEAFADKVAQDLYTHDVDWPGLSGGRGAYDTPFYNGGQSERRTNDPNSQKGIFPASQPVCIEGIGCAGRSDINYIAQGMWGARTGESKPVSIKIAEAWKLFEYGEKPSDETLFWLQYGYDYYLRWVEQQQANTSTP